MEFFRSSESGEMALNTEVTLSKLELLTLIMKEFKRIKKAYRKTDTYSESRDT